MNKYFLNFILILIVLTLSTSLLATDADYSDSSSLNLNLKTEAKFKINNADSVSADLQFYPINTELQNVNNINFYSNPQAELSNKNDSMVYSWKKPSGEYLFGYDSKISTFNTPVIITKKIEFPNSNKLNLEYVKESENIDYNAPIIKQKALEIAENEDDYYKLVYKYANWVSTNIKYDLDYVQTSGKTTYSTSQGVLKASWVLENKVGVCDEFASLLAAFLRSMNIPVRFVSGMVYSNLVGDWGPHAWVEVYFPNQGWVPFDPTYKQFGWIDSSHIALKRSLDGSEGVIEYSWLSTNNAQLEKIGEISNKINLVSENKGLEKLVSTSLNIPFEDYKAGSYLPLEVTLQNSKPYYVSTSLYLTKAPGIEGDNTKTILLEPYEKKKIYWIIKLSEDAEKNYIYKTKAEVKTLFGETKEIEIEYSLKGKLFTLEQAKELIPKELTNSFEYLNTICSLDKSEYYDYEKANIKCTISNSYSKSLTIEACAEKECKTLNIPSKSSQNLDYQFELDKSREIVISFKGKIDNKEILKYYTLDLIVNGRPEILISNFKASEVDYDKKGYIYFEVKPILDSKNIKISMNDRDILKIQNLNETKIFKGLSEFEVKVNDVSFLRKTSAFFQRLFFSLSKPEVTSF